MTSVGTKPNGRKGTPKVQRPGGDAQSDGKDVRSPPREYQDRRPLRFWQPFNDWWRNELERNGKRPSTAEITTWWELNAATTWKDNAPSLQDTRVHAKCLRSLPLVRDYFRNYRARKRSMTGRQHQSGSPASGEDLDPRGDGEDDEPCDKDPRDVRHPYRSERTSDSPDADTADGHPHAGTLAGGPEVAAAQLAALRATAAAGSGAGGLPLELLHPLGGMLGAAQGAAGLWPAAAAAAAAKAGGSGEGGHQQQQQPHEQLLRTLALQQLQHAAAMQQQLALAAIARNVALSRATGLGIHALAQQGSLSLNGPNGGLLGEAGAEEDEEGMPGPRSGQQESEREGGKQRRRPHPGKQAARSRSRRRRRTSKKRAEDRSDSGSEAEDEDMGLSFVADAEYVMGLDAAVAAAEADAARPRAPSLKRRRPFTYPSESRSFKRSKEAAAGDSETDPDKELEEQLELEDSDEPCGRAGRWQPGQKVAGAEEQEGEAEAAMDVDDGGNPGRRTVHEGRGLREAGARGRAEAHDQPAVLTTSLERPGGAPGPVGPGAAAASAAGATEAGCGRGGRPGVGAQAEDAQPQRSHSTGGRPQGRGASGGDISATGMGISGGLPAAGQPLQSTVKRPPAGASPGPEAAGDGSAAVACAIDVDTTRTLPPMELLAAAGAEVLPLPRDILLTLSRDELVDRVLLLQAQLHLLRQLQLPGLPQLPRLGASAALAQYGAHPGMSHLVPGQGICTPLPPHQQRPSAASGGPQQQVMYGEEKVRPQAAAMLRQRPQLQSQLAAAKSPRSPSGGSGLWGGQGAGRDYLAGVAARPAEDWPWREEAALAAALAGASGGLGPSGMGAGVGMDGGGSGAGGSSGGPWDPRRVGAAVAAAAGEQHRPFSPRQLASRQQPGALRKVISPATQQQRKHQLRRLLEQATTEEGDGSDPAASDGDSGLPDVAAMLGAAETGA